MQDCATYLDEMTRQQNCSTSILMELAGSRVGVHWRVHVLSCSRNLALTEPEWTVATSLLWPNRENKTFEGALFRALAEHDAHISRAAFQRILELT
jgi:hypothetical protein